MAPLANLMALQVVRTRASRFSCSSLAIHSAPTLVAPAPSSVDFGLPGPTARGLRWHAELFSHSLDRSLLRGGVRPELHGHPRRAFTQLIGVLEDAKEV